MFEPLVFGRLAVGHLALGRPVIRRRRPEARSRRKRDSPLALRRLPHKVLNREEHLARIDCIGLLAGSRGKRHEAEKQFNRGEHQLNYLYVTHT